MAEKQKEFLNELDELMKKFDISEMRANDIYIIFSGEEGSIAVGFYERGEFKHIMQTVHSYKP